MAGKGDKPRNCFSEKFKNNFDKIKWNVSNDKEVKSFVIKRGKKIFKYS